MKPKYLPIMLALALLLSSCGQGATQETVVTPDATELATEALPTAVVSEETSPAEQVTLTIESWRYEDLALWQDQIIPAFEASHPNIHLEFTPAGSGEYNASLNSKLAGGTAGDLITCRPFDVSLALYDQGHLTDLSDLPGIENFSDVAKSAWSTDDGSVTYCVPMASVIHGFIYNADAFKQLGLEEPTTTEEFMQVLETIKQDGTYTPLALGTADQWEAATMGWQNIGVPYWKGEEGRLALIAGTAKATDPEFVEPFQVMADWRPYLPSGYEAIKYSDSQALFTTGQAAIYPAGSWELQGFNTQAGFEMGAFPPPVKNEGDQCYINDHSDIAMGMNANSEHPEEASEFLQWMAGAEFAELYGNLLPGFFPFYNGELTLTDPLANEIIGWRQNCESTIRVTYQILSRGEPNFDLESYRVSVGVLNGTMSPEEAGQELQNGLDQWYKP